MRLRKMTALVMGLLAMTVGLTGAVQADRVDDYLKAEMALRHIPGLSVAVVQDGRVVKEQGYGLANVESSAPATSNTVYLLASVSKQFTAAGIMLLVAGRQGGAGRRGRQVPRRPAPDLARRHRPAAPQPDLGHPGVEPGPRQGPADQDLHAPRESPSAPPSSRSRSSRARASNTATRTTTCWRGSSRRRAAAPTATSCAPASSAPWA